MSLLQILWRTFLRLKEIIGAIVAVIAALWIVLDYFATKQEVNQLRCRLQAQMEFNRIQQKLDRLRDIKDSISETSADDPATKSDHYRDKLKATDEKIDRYTLDIEAIQNRMWSSQCDVITKER